MGVVAGTELEKSLHFLESLDPARFLPMVTFLRNEKKFPKTLASAKDVADKYLDPSTGKHPVAVKKGGGGGGARVFTTRSNEKQGQT